MIRAYRPRDRDDVLSAWQSASDLAHPFLSASFQAEVRQAVAEIYLPNAETWVWEHEGRVVGFIGLLDNEIGGLFVDPEFHGTGIGRALTDHARELKGALEVEVFRKNVIGRRFYAAYGFEPMAESVHEATGEDVLRLRLPVPT